ncbi:hypothetical protein FRX31_005791 [Thalictrum thalictroides]|uniref:Replication factor A C-terminal domain-containing protein n=1 Tax=Thalictrum thalictroides TaxID=46969 RepID=A0A7J6X4L8_THATH|nr:hypothetical protein FRX31_005791 [Thalictrum thalictroides]
MIIDLAQYVLGVLHIVTIVPYIRKSIVNATLSNDRDGMAVILDATNNSSYVDPEFKGCFWRPVATTIKFTVPAGVARPAPPVGPDLACPYYNKKMDPNDNATECGNCLAHVTIPAEKYRYRIGVEDYTGNTTFIAFDNVAYSLLNKTCNQLLEFRLKDNGEKQIQTILEKPLNKHYIFQIKFDLFNYREEYRSYKITNIFDGTNSHQTIIVKEEKIKESDEDNLENHTAKKMRKD